TMETTIEQQVTLDEALVPSTKRRILGEQNLSRIMELSPYTNIRREAYDFLEEHKNQKKSNEMYYPRFTKVIIHHFMMKKHSILRRNKASTRRKRSDSDTSITPPTAIPTPITTVAAAPRLTATAKGKQPVKTKSPSDPSEVARTKA
nr:hypothetical protein [Tanacetum cinerariifolium]